MQNVWWLKFYAIKKIRLSVSKVYNAPIIEKEVCKKLYFDWINDQNICFSYQKQASYKIGEGSPVECDGEFQGFLSWKKNSCGENQEIGVLTRMCDSISWIRSNVRGSTTP